MKIAVINFSGNVGKTTIARHLLSPRLDNAPVISIESINHDGLAAETLRGSQFAELQDQLLARRNAVVDIGASNVEDFMNLMESYEGSHEDFDRYVVPTVAVSKQQVDTISTIEALMAAGVPAAKIRVLFNMVDAKQSLQRLFPSIFAAADRNHAIALNTNAVIYQNPIFEKIKDSNKTISEISADPTDYLAKNADAIEAGASESEKSEIRQMIALKRLASRVTNELDAVFETLVH